MRNHFLIMTTLISSHLFYFTAFSSENDIRVLSFQQAVNIVTKACKSKHYTEKTCCALLDIDKALRWNDPSEPLSIISRQTLKQDNATYKQFNDLDLSGLIAYYSTHFPQMKNQSFIQEKGTPEFSPKITAWQVFLGSIAQHNHSISMEMSSPIFSQNTSSLGILAQQALHNAEYCKHVANAKIGNSSNVEALKAMLYFGEIALRENSQRKQQLEADQTTLEQTIEQNQITTDKIPVKSITKNNQQVTQQEIKQLTEAVVAINNQPTTDSISNIPTLTPETPKLQHPTQKEQKKETLLTTPFYKRPLFMSAVMCCAFFAWYFNEQIKTYWSSLEIM